MSGGSVIGTAWIEILPEMRGIQKAVSREIAGVDDEFEKAGKESGSRFSGSFKAAMGALAGAFAALGVKELVAQAAEASSTMSRLSASAEQNSVSAQSMEAAYGGLVGVLGDSERAVETAGNMFAMCGDNQAELESLTTSLTGAFSQFGDGMPIESLAEAANETANCGVVVGSFADALNWVNASTDQWSAALGGNDAALQAFNAAVDSGMSKEDAFNEALKTCSDEGERNQLVLDTLNALYGEAGQKYQEANADLIEYNKSQQAMSGALGSVGEAIIPIVTDLTNMAAAALERAVPAVEALADGVQDAISFISENIGTIAPVVAGVAGALAGLKLASFASSLGGLSGIFSTVAGAAKGLFGVLAANPIFLVVAAIAAVVAALVGLYATNEEFRAQVDAFFQQIAAVFAPAIAAIQQTIAMAMPLIQQAVTAALTVIQAIWSAVWPTLQAVLMPIISGISTFIQGAMTAIQGIINVVLGVINGDWSQVWSGIQQFIGGVWTAIQGVVSGVLGGIQALISSALGAISGIWNSIWSNVSSFVSDTWNNVTGAVSSGIDSMMGFISGIPDSIMGFFSGAGQWLLDAGKSIIDGLINGIKGAVDGAVGAVEDVVSQIRSFFPFSPAKRGPFSGHGYTTYSGRALMEDWGASMADAAPKTVDYAAAAVARVRKAMSSDIGATPRVSAAYEGFDALGAGAITQTINFNQPVQSPVEAARAMRLNARYGIAAIT